MNDKVTPGWEEFLTAGYEPTGKTWSPHRIWREGVHVLRTVAQTLFDLNQDERFDYICGIRGSGLALATLMSIEKRLPLFWFRDSTPNSLFPRYKYIEGCRILLVDTYAKTGYNLQRHAALLYKAGAIVRCTGIAWHMDLKMIDPPPPPLDELLKPYKCRVIVAWKWSQLLAMVETHDRPEIREIGEVEKASRDTFWP